MSICCILCTTVGMQNVQSQERYKSKKPALLTGIDSYLLTGNKQTKKREWGKLKIKASPSISVSRNRYSRDMRETEMEISRGRLVTHIIGDVGAPGQGSFNVACRSDDCGAVKPAAH